MTKETPKMHCFTQAGYEKFKQVEKEFEWNAQQELKKKLKEQQELVLKEMEYEQKIKDTLIEMINQERTRKEQEYKEKIQQLGNILKITDITENWDWKAHFAEMFSGYFDLFGEYKDYYEEGLYVYFPWQKEKKERFEVWRRLVHEREDEEVEEIWEGKTITDAYKFVEEQIEELREAGVSVVYRPYDAEERVSNFGELPLKKWYSIRFIPKNESQKRWIYKTVGYLEKFGITFDTYNTPTEKVWQIDWSFKFNKK